MKLILPILGIATFLFFLSCNAQTNIQKCESPKYEKIKGLSMVAQPDSFKFNPIPDVQAVNADWITVIPYGFTRTNQPTVTYNVKKWQWWGERPIGIKTTIRLAKEANVKVMLKPQIWVPGSWTGHLDFKTDEDWESWEAGYTKFIMQMVDICIEEKVEMLCIGTEFKIHAVNRPAYWRNLIKEIRKKYNGKLTYAANWDNFEFIPFWTDLDYVGVNAYFPLVNEKTPNVNDLKKAWQPTFDKIEKFYCDKKVPILFTEFGYLSVDGCAYNTWELEANIKKISVNETGQMNALEALFDTFWKHDWWTGGFLWKWYPDNIDHEGNYVKDYTPQGKKAEACVKKWYGK